MDKLFLAIANMSLTIFNMSLTGAFVIAAICLVRLPLRKAPKILSYCLWAVAGFRLVFPFSIESIFSLIPRAIPEVTPPPRTYVDIPPPSGTPEFTQWAISSDHSAYIKPLWTIYDTLAIIWLLGVTVMLVYGVVSYLILKRRMLPSVRAEANIYEAGNIKSPFVLGLVSPKIYLPNGLSANEREYILLHEQTHIRRRDHLVKFIAYFILCLHWFNPLAWVAFLLMGADMEMSCDERVMRELGGDIRDDYSLSLVRIATNRRILNYSPLAFGEGGMKERVKRVLNFKKPSRVIIIAAIVLVAGLSVGFALNRAGSEEAIDENEPPQEVTSIPDDWFGNPDGKDMTLGDVRELAAKGDELLFEDLQPYKGMNASSSFEYYLMVYGVEGGYRLIVESETAGKPSRVDLESIWEDGGSGIDIRYEDVEEFLRTHPSQSAEDAERAREVADMVEQNLAIITGEPSPVSNPYHYIDAHRTEYETIVALGDEALQYMFSEFAKGGQTDLRGFIMAAACHEILGIALDFDETIYNGQMWYDAYINAAPLEQVSVTGYLESASKLKLTYTNNTIYTLMTGEGYTLQEFIGDDWANSAQQARVNDIAYTIPPGGTLDQTVDLTLHGDISSRGRYRIMKLFGDVTDDTRERYDENRLRIWTFFEFDEIPRSQPTLY